jgi:methionine synthase II (cobalamin-independent)
MPDRILTSHAGSPPRPEELIARNQRRAEGDFTDEAEYLAGLRSAVGDVVARQAGLTAETCGKPIVVVDPVGSRRAIGQVMLRWQGGSCPAPSPTRA